MASILTILAKGNNPTEFVKNLKLIDNFMYTYENILPLISLPNINPRIYYNQKGLIPKNILDIIHLLKTSKEINQMYY